THTTHKHSLSLHDALPIFRGVAKALELVAPEFSKPIIEAFDDIDKGYKEHTERMKDGAKRFWSALAGGEGAAVKAFKEAWDNVRSEEHTSELQSRFDLVCR